MSLKVTAKRVVGPMAAWVAGLQEPADHVLAPILCYHGVAREASPEHVAAPAFEQQVQAVAAGGRCRSLGQIVDAIASDGWAAGSGDAGVALTFDDGYANLLDHAVPVLRASSLPATVFVVPGRLGRVADWPSPAPDAERRLLNLLEVEQLRASGFEIGAHGWTHIDLTTCPAQQRSDEIGQCLEFVTRKLGVERPVFCYPWGRYNNEVAVDVQRAGFVAAVAGGWGRRHRSTDLFSLRRVAVDWTDTITDFSWKLRGGYGWWTGSWWRELRGAG